MKRKGDILTKFDVLEETTAALGKRKVTLTLIEAEASCPAPKPICQRYLMVTGDFPDLLFGGAGEGAHPEVKGHEIAYGDYRIGFDDKEHAVVINGMPQDLADFPPPFGAEFGPDGYVGLI